MSYQFTSQEELDAAFRGELGAEMEQAADEIYEAAGYEIDYEGEEGDTDDAGTDDTQVFVAEVSGLESKIGRKLTRAEVDWLADQVPEEGQMPNFGQYAEQFTQRRQGGDGTDRETRVEALAEVADDARQEFEESEGKGNTLAGLTSQGDG